jgi:hypothetical protein
MEEGRVRGKKGHGNEKSEGKAKGMRRNRERKRYSEGNEKGEGNGRRRKIPVASRS